MSQNRSISQRLHRAKSTEAKRQAALDWAASWEREQKQLCHDLGKAIAADDYDQLCIIAGELKAVSEKSLQRCKK